MGTRWTWRRGAKRGIARGVAVFGSPGAVEDAEGLALHLGRCERLDSWLGRRGVALERTPGMLTVVDGLLDEWAGDPEIGPQLGNEVGLFVGSVVVAAVPGARWHVWPNGHPIIRLETNQEFDVVAMVGGRLRAGGPTLPEILSQAVHASA